MRHHNSDFNRECSRYPIEYLPLQPFCYLRSQIQNRMTASADNPYEQARTSLTDYNHTVALGLQALLYHRHFSDTPMRLLPLAPPHQHHGLVGVILFGSGHGLCGQFNEQIVTYALEQLRHRQIHPDQCLLATVGARLIPYLELAKQPIQMQFSLPSSFAGTTRLIQDLLRSIQQWRFCQNTEQVPSMPGEIAEVPRPNVE